MGGGRNQEAARGRVKERKIKEKGMCVKAFMNAFPGRSTQPLDCSEYKISEGLL